MQRALVIGMSLVCLYVGGMVGGVVPPVEVGTTGSTGACGGLLLRLGFLSTWLPTSGAAWIHDHWPGRLVCGAPECLAYEEPAVTVKNDTPLDVDYE
jgi:hypothetical protein